MTKFEIFVNVNLNGGMDCSFVKCTGPVVAWRIKIDDVWNCRGPWGTIIYNFLFLGLKCQTFIGKNMTRDRRIHLYDRLARINIRQYERRFAYAFRYFIIFNNTEIAFHMFLTYLE